MMRKKVQTSTVLDVKLEVIVIDPSAAWSRGAMLLSKAGKNRDDHGFRPTRVSGCN